MGIGAVHGICAPGKARVFAQLQSFVVGVRARWIEKQNAKRMARPAVVAEKALEARLFDAGLFVNGSDFARSRSSRGFAQTRMIRLGPAQNGVNERGSSRPEVERGDGSTVAGLQQRLIFGSSEEQLASAIGIVIERLDAGHQRARSVKVREGFGANEIAPRIGTEMRRIDSTEYAVPKSVVALCPQEQIARLKQFLGSFCASRP